MLTETRPRSKTDPSVVGARVNRLILTRVSAVEYTSRMTKSFDVETNRRLQMAGGNWPFPAAPPAWLAAKCRRNSVQPTDPVG